MSNVTLSELPRSTARSGVIDFHNHHVPERFELTAAKAAPPSQRARWEAHARKLPDEKFLLSDIREGELSARVVNIPANLIADADGHVPHETIVAMNDDLAALVARHPDRIYGLASVDAYDGDRAGREAERAIRELGLRGLFVDCARGDQLIDAPQARPTLEVAAKLEGTGVRPSRGAAAADETDGPLRTDRDFVCTRDGEFSVSYRSD